MSEYEKQKWRPGQSGNPAGRPVDAMTGVRRRARKEAPLSLHKLIELSHGDDPVAAAIAAGAILSIASQSTVIFSKAKAPVMPRDLGRDDDGGQDEGHATNGGEP